MSRITQLIQVIGKHPEGKHFQLCGASGSGKTRTAELLKFHLESMGIACVVIDEKTPEQAKELAAKQNRSAVVLSTAVTRSPQLSIKQVKP